MTTISPAPTEGPAPQRFSPTPEQRRKAFALCTLGAVVGGVILGVIWGLVVPGVRGFVIKDGVAGDLTSESTLRFDAVGMFAGLSIIFGVIAALAIWQARPLRGFAGAVATVVLSLLGAAVGIVIGDLVAQARFPGHGSTPPGQYYLSAPSPLISGATVRMGGAVSAEPAVLVVAPLVAILTLVIIALLQRNSDCGVGDGDPAEGLAVYPSGRRPQGGELVGDPHPGVGEPVQGGGTAPAGPGSAEGSGGRDDAAPAQDS